jgi:uncharacterized membrane protein
MNKENIKLFILLMLVAFGLATGVMLTIDAISMGIDEANKIIEKLVKLLPHKDMDEVLKKELKDCQEQVEPQKQKPTVARAGVFLIYCVLVSALVAYYCSR